MSKHLVLIAGNLGVGKTSLAERISEKLEWHVGYESVSDNPYLTDFYNNMQAWSFHLQVYFLGHRAEQHLTASELPQSAILDRSIYEDAHIFAKALYHSKSISERDYKSYLKVFTFVVKTLPPPNLLIYLRAPLNVLTQRIKGRGQKFDKDLSSEYLTMIDSFYENWIPTFNLCPVLIINTGNLDYISQPDTLDTVTKQILEKLSH